MKKIINPANGSITFRFDPTVGADGTKTPIPDVVFEVAKVAENNRAYAALFGFASRIGDAAAIQKTAENGYKVTEAMRRAEVAAMVAHYHSGSDQWDVRAKAAKAPALNPVILAIAQKMGCSYEKAQAKVAAQFLETLE